MLQFVYMALPRGAIIVILNDGVMTHLSSNKPIGSQGDLRLSGPPSGQGAGGAARNNDKKISADLKAGAPMAGCSWNPRRKDPCSFQDEIACY
ncbi:hypothetical protein PoB_003835800 [Plakobranchus ocellatus]|uniref:Uncharacterized protein n=1 Tax=Plakobranchus ocellatus TaxID=259542 RepID=A0AAV4AYC5_9GAST|nr:hypothetical protein PoB_003835800 [Plakobranchus ocellatus]